MLDKKKKRKLLGFSVCACTIPYSKLLVELVNRCLGAGEVIGAGPHISAFYSVQFSQQNFRNVL